MVGHTPEELPAAIAGISAALSQHIDALRQQFQQGRQGRDGVLQTGKAAVEGFPQGVQLRAFRRFQTPAGAEPTFTGFVYRGEPGQKRFSPQGKAEGCFIGVGPGWQEPPLPAQDAGPTDMEQQGIPAPGLLAQVELCGEDADVLPVPGHSHSCLLLSANFQTYSNRQNA